MAYFSNNDLERQFVQETLKKKPMVFMQEVDNYIFNEIHKLNKVKSNV